MIGWVERLVSDLQAAAGIDLPTDADLPYLLLALSEWLEVRWDGTPFPQCVHRAGRPALVYLPAALTGHALRVALAEESGHARCTHGMASVLERLAREDRRFERLARRWRGRDERVARAFMLAWLLPARVVRRLPPWELAERTGYPPEFVAARCREVREWDRRQASAPGRGFAGPSAGEEG